MKQYFIYRDLYMFQNITLKIVQIMFFFAYLQHLWVCLPGKKADERLNVLGFFPQNMQISYL